MQGFSQIPAPVVAYYLDLILSMTLTTFSYITIQVVVAVGKNLQSTMHINL